MDSLDIRSFDWKGFSVEIANCGQNVTDELSGRWELLLDGRRIAGGEFPVGPLPSGASRKISLPGASGRIRPDVSPATWGERHANVFLYARGAEIARRQFVPDFKCGLRPPVRRIQPMRRKGAPLVTNRVDSADGTAFDAAATLVSVEWFGLGDDGFVALRTSPLQTLSGPCREVRRMTLTGGSDRLEIAARHGTFSFSVAAGPRVSITGISPAELAFDDWNPAAEFILTAPFQQNVGTDAFTICCETSRPDDALRLVYDGGEVPFTFRRADFSGTYLAVARVTGCRPGSVIRYDLSTGGFPGVVTLWKDCEDDFKCAIWSDFQAGVLHVGSSGFDWEDDPFRCGEMMFRDMISEGCEFAVSTGDTADRGDYETELRPLYLERTCGIIGRVMPFYVAWGNHDSAHVQNHFFAANPTDGSFAFLKNNCLFICIDDREIGNDKDPASPELLVWLRGVLASDTARKAKFRFAFQHVAIYEEAFGNCNRRLVSLYEEFGVDCVFSGDHHGYERIERGKIRQVVEGCMGYFGHKGGLVNCFGDDMIVGGHKPLKATWRFQEPGKPGVLGPETPVVEGLIPGYSTLEVHGDTATWKLIGFNADGSKIGVVDQFTMVRGQRPDKPMGMATERYCWSQPDSPVYAMKFMLTGKGGHRVDACDFGGCVVEGFDTFRDYYDSIGGKADKWNGRPFTDGDTVGVVFTRKDANGELLTREIRLLPDGQVTTGTAF